MRTRTMSEPTVWAPGELGWTYEELWVPNITVNTVSARSSEDRKSFAHVSTIVDDPIRASPKKTKVVDHLTSTFKRTFKGDEFEYFGDSNPSQHVRLKGKNVYWASYTGWNNSSLDDIDVASFSSYFQATYANSKEQFLADAFHRFFSDNQVNNLVNIVEAKDLNPHIMSTEQKLRRLSNETMFTDPRKGKRRNAKLLAKGLLRNVIGESSSKFLYYSFGLVPLLSDFDKMRKAASTLRRDIQKASDRAGKVEVLRSFQTAKVTHPQTGIWSTPTSGVPRKVQFSIGQEQLSKRVCVIRGIRRPRFDSSKLQQLDYLLRRFVTNGPASFIWEKIPFSFVVDWFIDLRSAIDTLDNILTGDFKSIVDASYSELLDVQVSEHHSDGAMNLTVVGLDGAELAWRHIRKYHREPVHYDPKITLNPRFGKSQAAISAALLAQAAPSRMR
jgi:hypothetical protein